MTDLAHLPIIAGQAGKAPYYVAEQKPDNYAEKRVNGNIQYALKFEGEPKEVYGDLGDTSSDHAHQSTQNVSRTSGKINVAQLLLLARDYTLEQRQEQARRTLTPTAEWEGYVESITEDKFVVKMTNVRTDSSLPTDQAVFSKNEVSEHERHLLNEGAIVRWVIGRERLSTGQVRKVAELHFRRLPAHTDADYQRALKKANALLAEIDWDDNT